MHGVSCKEDTIGFVIRLSKATSYLIGGRPLAVLVRQSVRREYLLCSADYHFRGDFGSLNPASRVRGDFIELHIEADDSPFTGDNIHKSVCRRVDSGRCAYVGYIRINERYDCYMIDFDRVTYGNLRWEQYPLHQRRSQCYHRPIGILFAVSSNCALHHNR